MSENRVHGQCYLSVDVDWCMHTQYSVRSTPREIDSSVAPCRPAFWNWEKNVQAIMDVTRQFPSLLAWSSMACRMNLSEIKTKSLTSGRNRSLENCILHWLKRYTSKMHIFEIPNLSILKKFLWTIWNSLNIIDKT